VAFDSSKVSESVLELAKTHAKAFKADIFVLTSLKQGPELKKVDIDKVEIKLAKVKTLFETNDIPCEVQVSVCIDSAGEDVVRFAKNNDFDEIIIGVRKKSKVGKLIFGSTAQYTILKAPCPVVTVK